MQNWEYEIVGLSVNWEVGLSGNSDEDMIPVLKHKGKLGWELVSVVANINRNEYEYLAFFKRPHGG
jgi:hypothetical protein